MSRKFYACQCLFKQGIENVKNTFGKTIFVFNSLNARNEFLSNVKNEKEFFKVTQKEAYNIVGLDKPKTIPCLYNHSQYHDMLVLSEIKQCYGTKYFLLGEI